jgi:DNA-binding XRE family transcriptional regulator
MLLLWKTSKYKPIKVDKTTIINLEKGSYHHRF